MTDDIFVYGERVRPFEEVVDELGITVDDARRFADAGMPCTRAANGFVGLRRDHVEVWKQMLAPVVQDPMPERRPSRTLVGDRWVEDQEWIVEYVGQAGRPVPHGPTSRVPFGRTQNGGRG